VLTANQLFHEGDAVPMSADDRKRAVRQMMEQASREMNDYVREEIARHRRDRPDDLLTVMLEATGDQALTDDEVRSTAVLMLVAGYDTTAKTMTDAVVLLERYPDQRRLLVEDPSLIPAAVEEVMRFWCPAQMLVRVAAQEGELAGRPLRAGEVLYTLPAAANRDPGRWTDPQAFDIRREPKAHLGFSYGPHLCLGAALARLETKVALERLLRLAPEYRLRDVDFGRAFYVRGPERGVLEASAL
jgi:cytochrome P450